MKIQLHQLFVGALLAGASCWGAETRQRPNIVVILADDAGYTDLGCYGGEIDTPNLDALAREGVRFRSFYNNARCSPTRASLLTGLEAAKVGFGAGTLGGWNREMKEPAYRARLPYDIPLLPEILREAGYRTLMAGKWHLGGSLMKTGRDSEKQWQRTHPGWELTPGEIEADFQALPSQRGFDRFFGIYSGETHQFLVPSADAPGAPPATTLEGHVYSEGNLPAKIEATRDYAMRCYATTTDSYPYHPSDGKTARAWYAADGTTDRAIGMLREAVAEKALPFFLYLAYQSPHAPLQAPQELVDKYLARYQDLGPVEAARIAGLTKEGLFPEGALYEKHFSGKRKFGEPALAAFREKAAIHAAMMENMDDNIGRLVTALKESGQWDNTLLMFLSDNGAASGLGDLFNKPYRGCKALVWEGGARTPFIATWPGHIPPGTISKITGWVGDIVPTCLAATGFSYTEEFRGRRTSPLDGRNLLPAMEGKTLEQPAEIFFNDKGQQAVIYRGRWKLLVDPGWYAQRDQSRVEPIFELYDLENDPAETADQSAAQPELVRKLAALCAEWQADSGIVAYGELLRVRPDFSQ